MPLAYFTTPRLSDITYYAFRRPGSAGLRTLFCMFGNLRGFLGYRRLEQARYF
jgi:hypothetical protein